MTGQQSFAMKCRLPEIAMQEVFACQTHNGPAGDLMPVRCKEARLIQKTVLRIFIPNYVFVVKAINSKLKIIQTFIFHMYLKIDKAFLKVVIPSVST